MKTLVYSTQYKKDFKKYKNQPKKLERLLEILRMLENEVPIPKEFKPHKLIGQYKGCIECHIESDLLLIWIDENENIIEIVRLGSHSELF